MEKGSKYIRYGKIAGISSLPLVGIFVYLAMIGATDTTGVSYTEHCAGTVSDPCLLFWNVTMLKTVYIQQNDNWLQTNPTVSKIELKRKWGNYWRTIDLTKPWNSKVKYALKLEKGKSYEFMLVAYKYHPRDVINWSINPSGQWKEALAHKKDTCEKYKTDSWVEYKQHFKTVKRYSKENNTWYNVSVLDYTEEIPHTEKKCIKHKTEIQYADSTFEPSKEHKGCTVYDDKIVCDDGDFGDGNGDGICQSGETCYEYSLTDKIELKKITNGD